MSNELMQDPRREELSAETDRLRGDVARLLSERDTLILHTCPQAEAEYAVKLGTAEYEVFEWQIKVRRARRKAELIRSHINRRIHVDDGNIEAVLDSEFSQYRQKLDEMLGKMDRAVKYRTEHAQMSKKDSDELKKLYRGIMKKLHPDVNPDAGEKSAELLQRAMEAYKHGDTDTLRAIDILCRDPAQADPKAPDALAGLTAARDTLLRKKRELEEEINRIRGDFPCNVIELLNDPEALAAHRAQLQNELRQLKAAYLKYDGMIKEMEASSDGSDQA